MITFLSNTPNLKTKVVFLLLFVFIFAYPKGAKADEKIELVENIIAFLNNDSRIDSRLNIDSLTNHKALSDIEIAKMAGNIGDIYREEGQLARAIELFLMIAHYYEGIPFPSEEEVKTLIGLYIPLGASHEELGLWSKAMSFYLTALNLAEKHHFENYQAMLFNNIGVIHFNKTELEKAKSYFQKALIINKKLGNKTELFYNYNNLAEISMSEKKYESALDFALLGIQQINNTEEPYLYYYLQSSIGNIYQLKKDYKMALTYLQNAARYQEINSFVSDLALTYSFLGATFEGLNQIDSAKAYIEKSLTVAQEMDNKHLESRLLRESAEFYSRIGDIDKAFQYLSNANIITDSINRVDNQQKIDILEGLYNTYYQNLLSNKSKKSTNNLIAIIVLCLTLLAILLFFFLLCKKKKRTEAGKLSSSNNNSMSKEQELRYIIDEKHRELTTQTLSLIKNNEFIDDIKNELKSLLLEINPRDRAHKDRIRNLLDKLNNHNKGSKWEEFSYYFEKVHPDFYKNLDKCCPTLTLKEKRLCSFLLLGLSSKEISAITYKEVRSVESARNRLRKKFEINPEVNIVDFLNGLNSKDD